MIRNKNEFIRYFESEIRPKYENDIEKGKGVKEKMNKMVKKVVLIFVLVGIIPALFLGPLGAFLGFIISFIYIFFQMKNNPEIGSLFLNYQGLSRSKDELFGEIVSKVLPSFTFSNQNAISKEEFLDYGLISSSKVDKFKSEDAIIGTLNDKNIRISEAQILNEVGSNDNRRYVKIFSGLIAEIDLNHDSSFKMLVTKKNFHPKDLQSWFDNLGQSHQLEEISISNVFLDENYRVLTNDSIKTNKILQPRNIDKMVSFFERENKKIYFGFSKNKLILLVEDNNNMFEVFNDGKFEPDIIWDELINALNSINFIEEMDIDFSKL